MNEFGKFLKREISQKNFSQNKFARKIGISSYYIGQMIKGEKKPPSRELQIKMANALDFDENKKVKFFNIIAKEKKDIPSDIYNYLMDNESKWDEVREVLNKGEKNYD